MDNVTIFTYTHENCIDIWEPYLDSLDKYATEIPSIVVVNEDYENHGRHKFRVYGEFPAYTQNMNRMGIRGVYTYNNEPMRKNSSHYDTSVFPYIATAIVQRKWNITEYGDELNLIFEKYDIDPSLRGSR